MAYVSVNVTEANLFLLNSKVYNYICSCLQTNQYSDMIKFISLYFVSQYLTKPNMIKSFKGQMR